MGALGRHHARILAELPGAELISVVDINESRAREIGGLVNAHASVNATELLGRVDAVTVAVPTEAHLKVAMPFLQHGTAVLVEKPLARDAGEAQQMIAAAAASGAVLAVGHTERFNPAVATVSISGVVTAGAIRGSATISASTLSGVVGSAVVTVTPAYAPRVLALLRRR